MDENISGGIKTDLETRIEQRDSGHRNSNNPSAETTNETRRGRGRPRKTESGNQETKLLGLHSVDEPLSVSVALPGEDQQEKPQKKKAGRPKKTASKSGQIDSTQIQILLVTMSALISSRPGMEIWNLSAQEAQQIADPLANILAKNEALGNAIGEHADAFALITACFVVFLPKALMYMASKPKKPKNGDLLNYGNSKPTKPTNQDTKVANIDREHVQRNASNAKNSSPKLGGQLSQIISPVGGF